MQRLVAPASLHAFARACFAAAGVAKRDADWSATALVESDLRGISSHGVMRLPWYVHGLKSGKINAKPHLAWIRTGPVTAVLDGDHALGFVSAKEAAAYEVSCCRRWQAPRQRFLLSGATSGFLRGPGGVPAAHCLAHRGDS